MLLKIPSPLSTHFLQKLSYAILLSTPNTTNSMTQAISEATNARLWKHPLRKKGRTDLELEFCYDPDNTKMPIYFAKDLLSSTACSSKLEETNITISHKQQRENRFNSSFYPPTNQEEMTHFAKHGMTRWYRGMKMHAIDWVECRCKDSLVKNAQAQKITYRSNLVSSFKELVKAYKSLDERDQYMVRVGSFQGQDWKNNTASEYMTAFNIHYREGVELGYFSYLATVGLECARKPLRGNVSVNRPRVLDEYGAPIRNKGTKYTRDYDVSNTQMKRKERTSNISQRPTQRVRGASEETDMMETLRGYFRRGHRLGTMGAADFERMQRVGSIL
jgi:hypothetical protein